MTTAPTWYYGRDGETVGPMPLQQLRAMAERGELRRDDSVWTDGMPEWVPASTRAELFPAVAAMPAASEPVSLVGMASRAAASAGHSGYAPHAHAAAAAASVGYYVPSGNMPPRAAENLRRHAGPTGDTGDWPLDDGRVATFREAMTLRKKVVAAAQLYKALFALNVIAAVITLFSMLAVMSSGPGRGGPPAAAAMGFGVWLLVVGGIAALYLVAWRSTMRSQRWAPLTMLIVFVLFGLLFLLSLLLAAAGMGSAGGAGGPPMVVAMIGPMIGLVLLGAFAWVSWQAFAAVPRYLAQPAWCQELIATSKL